MRVLVIGGTVLIGSRLVARLREREHEAAVASPSGGTDTVTGDGLRRAMDRTDVVIDVTNPRPSDTDTLDFFLRSGVNIAAAEVADGVRHHLVPSVVGAHGLTDAVYFCAKVVQEAVVERSGIPYTIIRSTQFFEFLPRIADVHTRDGLVGLPAALVQPAAANDVTDALVAAALEPATNRAVEVAGPDPFPLTDAVGRVLAVSDRKRVVIADRDALYFGVHVEDRTLVPEGHPLIAPTSLGSWLANTRLLLSPGE
jgi:uncharacterized protein YbjT (DUF2867 family)